MKILNHIFSGLAKLVFVIALFFAPLAYGSTRPWALAWLQLMLAAVIGLWGLGVATAWRLPRIPWVLGASVVAILILGWGMTFNAHFRNDGIQHVFIPVEPAVTWLPGTVDAFLSARIMVRISVLLGVLLFVCDSAKTDEKWLRLFWMAMCVAGFAVVAFGLYHRATGQPPWLWGRAERYEFSTFRYHPNAGAFINIVCALALGLLVRAFTVGKSRIDRVAWFLVLVTIVAGGIVNASKAAQGVLLLTVLGAGAWCLPICWKLRDRIRWWMVAPFLLVAVCAVGALVHYAGLETTGHRWEEILGPNWSNEYRIEAYKVGVSMVPDAGWAGFGPGTFPPLFPHYTVGYGDRIAGIWRYLHQDYIQTVIEYGYLGAALWAVVFFGAIAKSAAYIARHRSLREGTVVTNANYAGAAMLALIGVGLHALVDFPLQIASIQLYVLTIVGLAWSLGRRAPATEGIRGGLPEDAHDFSALRTE